MPIQEQVHVRLGLAGEAVSLTIDTEARDAVRDLKKRVLDALMEALNKQFIPIEAIVVVQDGTHDLARDTDLLVPQGEYRALVNREVCQSHEEYFGLSVNDPENFLPSGDDKPPLLQKFLAHLRQQGLDGGKITLSREFACQCFVRRNDYGGAGVFSADIQLKDVICERLAEMLQHACDDLPEICRNTLELTTRDLGCAGHRECQGISWDGGDATEHPGDCVLSGHPCRIGALATSLCNNKFVNDSAKIAVDEVISSIQEFQTRSCSAVETTSQVVSLTERIRALQSVLCGRCGNKKVMSRWGLSATVTCGAARGGEVAPGVILDAGTFLDAARAMYQGYPTLQGIRFGVLRVR